MDKIALISDIHGNLEALKAVLNDIEKRGITKIYCLGDIIDKGVHTKECLRFIKEKCEIIIKGNCDEFYASNIDPLSYDELHRKRIIWNKSFLTKEDEEFINNLPFSYEFYMSGSLIRLFHATPTKLKKSITQMDNLETKRSLFAPSKYTSDKYADVVIYGHIHTQYLSRLYNRTIANTGSVGNPIEIVRNKDFDSKNIETTRANYLIIEGNLNSTTYDESISFQFIRVPYDIEKELDNDIFNIEKDNYVKELKYGKYRDLEKVKNHLKDINAETKF